ncbi:MAG: hypothetical protein E7404_07985 [Ruminococcaceae bacterium]|nr:hypothetical protein [Oscillospiraceae bacterium]
MLFASLLHEAGHLLIILKLKIKLEKIKIMPYGIAIKTEMIKNPTDEILVCVAGPAVNFLLFIIFKKYVFFSLCNIIICILNLLPALPLDGGCVLKAYLSKKEGYINAIKKLIIFTKITGVIVVFLGMIVLIITKYNISLLIIGMFLLYNIIYEKENIASVKKNLLCNEFLKYKERFKIRKTGAKEDVKLINFICEFSYDYVVEICVYDNHFNKIGEISQDLIVPSLLKYGSLTTCGDLLERIKTNDKKS